jgi:hypothetical protein
MEVVNSQLFSPFGRVGGKPKAIFTCWKETTHSSIVGMQISQAVFVNGYSGIQVFFVSA